MEAGYINPGKFMMAGFDPKLRKEAILGLWGHSFQANFRACKPVLADSIQIHVRIKKEALGDVLQQSGWNRVFMVPKNDDSFAANVTYSVLWTGADLEQTQIQAKLLQSNLGLIKNRGRYGIRVHFDAFKQSWQILFPDVAVPDQIKVTQVFRVQGLPPNVTNTEIKTWIEQLGWEAKPIRRVAHGVWLVGGSKMPDQETCTFNGNVVMISLVDRRDTSTSNPVIVGKALFTSDKPPVGNTLVDDFKDPWAAYRRINPATPSQPSVVSPQHTVSRTTDGPTTTKLQEQDAKIASLGNRLDALQKKLSDETQDVKHMIHESEKAHKGDLQQLAHTVDQKLNSHEKDMNQRFSSLQATIEAGKQSQDEQFRLLRDMLSKTVAAPANHTRKAQKTGDGVSPGLSRQQSDADMGDES